MLGYEPSLLYIRIPAHSPTPMGQVGTGQSEGARGSAKDNPAPFGLGYAGCQVHPEPPSNHPVHTYDHHTSLCPRIQSGMKWYISPTRSTLPEDIFVKGGRSSHTRGAAAKHRIPQRGAVHSFTTEAQVRKWRGRM
jgi:hypothetical protein